MCLYTLTRAKVAMLDSSYVKVTVVDAAVKPSERDGLII